jgi:U4/U6 small nuclear ribonucleoprotein PRP31
MLNFFIVYQVENAKNNKVLEQFLSQATIMVVSVTASTTQGGNLNDDELTIVKESADVALALNDYKKKIFEYVESRMAFIAPNLSIIVGASTAAKLVS